MDTKKQKRILTSQLPGFTGKTVMLEGWLYNVRDLGGVSFLIIQDREGLAQVVVKDKKEMTKLEELQVGSILRVSGLVAKTDATELGVEIQDPKLEVLVPIKEPPPVTYNQPNIKANLDTQLDYRPIILRNPKQKAIFRVQSGILKAFADSLRSRGFTEFRSPVLSGAPSESGADVFEVDYFDGKAYLAQSPQIYKQIMIGVFERVFTISPVFRAEKHKTTRHLTELTQLDAEIGFIENYEEVLDLIEAVVRDIFAYLEANHKQDLATYGATLPKLPKAKFPRIKVREALKVIESRTGKSAKREELDVDPEDERELGKWALEEFDSDFLWLLNFKKDKNFYTWNNPDDPDESLSYDLECRGLEWLSGTHRIHEFDKLIERFRKEGLSEENYQHYLQAIKHGIPSEAGFSFGLERMTQQIFGLKNIRQATLFPSDMNRIAGASRLLSTVNGGENMVKAIKDLLNSRGVDFEFFEHEAVRTSEEASEVRGTDISEGAKALIVAGKKTKQNYMVVLPADKKIDFGALKKSLGEEATMEKPEIILEKYGIEVGGVPPFGNLLGLKVFTDKGLLDKREVDFNCGLRTTSIKMNPEDLVDCIDGDLVDITK